LLEECRLLKSSEDLFLDSEHLGLDSDGTLFVSERDEGHPFATVSGGFAVLVLGVLGFVDSVTGLAGRGSGLGSLLLGTRASGGLADGGVDSGVVVLEGFAVEGLGPSGELLSELVGLVFLEHVVVLFDVDSEDVLSVLGSIERGLGLLNIGGLSTFVGDDLSLGDVSSGESLGLVRDVQTTVTGTLEGTEDTVSGGGADETDIEESLERSGRVLNGLNVVDITVNLGGSSVFVSKLEAGEESSGGEETNTVSSGVVGGSSFKSVLLELERVSIDKDLVTFEGGVDDLADDSLVGSSDNESVLSGVVLVLVLEDQSTSGVVISLSLSSPSELSLVAHRVRLVLQNLNVTHID